ncbi:MAG: hypothetical protein AB8F34_16120 [Akkermansiaceae bacterium]
MKRILFQPFDIKKWFLLGFTAWLAQLLESGSSGGSYGSSNNTTQGGTAEDSRQAWEMFRQWAQDNSGMIITVLSTALIVGVAILIALVWVRSRGKFMFLDNVIHNRALIGEPWREYREEGNSLCRWTLCLMAVFLGILLAIMGFSGWYVFDIVTNNTWTAEHIYSLVGIGLVVLFFGIIWFYVSVLLEHFVVPMMYRERITATEAWRKFLPLHKSLLRWFLLFALWYFVLSLAVGLAVVILGFATCCIGMIVLSIPYLGVVLILPTFVFFRLLGVEFLRQCGDEFDALTAHAPPMPELGG